MKGDRLKNLGWVLTVDKSEIALAKNLPLYIFMDLSQHCSCMKIEVMFGWWNNKRKECMYKKKKKDSQQYIQRCYFWKYITLFSRGHMFEIC